MACPACRSCTPPRYRTPAHKVSVQNFRRSMDGKKRSAVSCADTHGPDTPDFCGTPRSSIPVQNKARSRPLRTRLIRYPVFVPIRKMPAAGNADPHRSHFSQNPGSFPPYGLPIRSVSQYAASFSPFPGFFPDIP